MLSSVLRFQALLRYVRNDCRKEQRSYRRLLAYVSVSFGRSRRPVLSIHVDVLI